jgi:aspartate racemase
MAEHYLTELKAVQPEGPYYIAGYCFGTIVAFEMAQSLLRAGEEVELLAMFNGPSPVWTRTYRNLEEQPGRRARVATTPGSTLGQPGRPRVPPAGLPRKVLRVLRDPERLRRWLGWARFRLRRTKERGVDYASAKTRMILGRPLSEDLRGRYFLRIAAVAERAYEPSVYPGEILLFHGDGLYDDPELGWTGLAAAGVHSIAVPGAASNNRQLMDEPYVGVIGEHLQSRLEELRARAGDNNGASALADMSGVGARV